MLKLEVYDYLQAVLKVRKMLVISIWHGYTYHIFLKNLKVSSPTPNPNWQLSFLYALTEEEQAWKIPMKHLFSKRIKDRNTELVVLIKSEHQVFFILCYLKAIYLTYR